MEKCPYIYCVPDTNGVNYDAGCAAHSYLTKSNNPTELRDTASTLSACPIPGMLDRLRAKAAKLSQNPSKSV